MGEHSSEKQSERSDLLQPSSLSRRWLGNRNCGSAAVISYTDDVEPPRRGSTALAREDDEVGGPIQNVAPAPDALIPHINEPYCRFRDRFLSIVSFVDGNDRSRPGGTDVLGFRQELEAADRVPETFPVVAAPGQKNANLYCAATLKLISFTLNPAQLSAARFCYAGWLAPDSPSRGSVVWVA
jgi:hypothetical protein